MTDNLIYDLIYMFYKRVFSGWVWDNADNQVSVDIIREFLKEIFQHINGGVVTKLCDKAYKITFNIPERVTYKAVFRQTYIGCRQISGDNISYNVTRNSSNTTNYSIVIIFSNQGINTMYPAVN